MTTKKVDDVFFDLLSEKNSDGTKHLRLRGKELFQRFGFRLKEIHMYKLTSYLNKHPEIISLDLSYNEIGNEGLKNLSQYYFQNEHNLKHLNLLHCDIGPEGLKWLSAASCLNLKSLRLEGNKLGTQGARYIGKIIDLCKNLEDLDIGEIDQTNESIEAVLMVIERSSLKSINISRIIPKPYYSTYNTSQLADNIAILMKLNTSIEVLRVQKCEFDGHDIELLVDGLKSHCMLVMLDLGANKCSDHGLMYIAKWLKTRPKLIGLRLPANRITIVGAQNLATSLPFSRIRFLDLQHNRIAKQGILELLCSIKKPTPLRMLYIWGNEIGSEELETLDKFLKAGVLEQECIDVKIYVVDGVKMAAYYPTNMFTQMSYSVSNYGFPPELKIVRNNIVAPTAKPRALINFEFVRRYPPSVNKDYKEEQNVSNSNADKSTVRSLSSLERYIELSYNEDASDRLFV